MSFFYCLRRMIYKSCLEFIPTSMESNKLIRQPKQHIGHPNSSILVWKMFGDKKMYQNLICLNYMVLDKIS